eukprot:Rhum_TRINITY_DN14357_c21_g1::Rhum_TRINITY_DN14357_c21_g1_i1::g.84184::m.84184
MALCLPLRQQHGDDAHLARRVVVDGERVAVLILAAVEVRVVADAAQRLDGRQLDGRLTRLLVLEVDGSGQVPVVLVVVARSVLVALLALLVPALAAHHLVAQGVLVPVQPLHLRRLQVLRVRHHLRQRQLAEQHLLRLLRQRQHVLLHAAQQVRRRQVPQLHAARVGVRDLLRACELEAARVDGHLERLSKGGQVAELAGVDEVEERPQFAELVLQRRPREHDPVRRRKLFDGTGCEGARVADVVSLVEDDVVELDDVGVREQPNLLAHPVVRREQDGVAGVQRLQQRLPVVRPVRRGRERARRVQAHDAHLRHPLVELPHPLRHERHRAHHDHRTLQQAAPVQPRDEGRNLHRLPHPHLVAQHAARLLQVQLPQPLHSRLLVLEQRVPHRRSQPETLRPRGPRRVLPPGRTLEHYFFVGLFVAGVGGSLLAGAAGGAVVVFGRERLLRHNVAVELVQRGRRGLHRAAAAAAALPQQRIPLLLRAADVAAALPVAFQARVEDAQRAVVCAHHRTPRRRRRHDARDLGQLAAQVRTLDAVSHHCVLVHGRRRRPTAAAPNTLPFVAQREPNRIVVARAAFPTKRGGFGPHLPPRLTGLLLHGVPRDHAGRRVAAAAAAAV